MICKLRTKSNSQPIFGNKLFNSRGYICMDGEPREIRCNNGLHWNNQTNQCDLPRSANCTISQGTNGFN